MVLRISTDKNRQVIDITELIEDNLPTSGLVNIFVQHTTAAITTADLDPGTDQDLLEAFAAMTPDKQWRHPHNPAHLPDHLWSSIIGPSVVIPFKNRKLLLGTWQRVVFIELDGPRKRQLELTIFEIVKSE